MKFSRYLSIKNLKRKPARTAALVILTAFLAFAIFGGSVIVASLQNGLSSYRSRLGADIIVVPNEARSKGTLRRSCSRLVPRFPLITRLTWLPR